jgi:excisionase family DNA binding protein
MEMIRPMLQDNGQHEEAEDALLTIEEAARFLNTSKGQIYQWVNNSQHGLGTFPYHKAGKLLRFSKSEILKWMRNGKRRQEGR